MRLAAAAIAFLACTPAAWPQASFRPAPVYMNDAVIHQDGSSMTIEVSDPLPLLKVLDRLQDRYRAHGWAVDYEDPPYTSPYDLVLDAPPAWTKTHPGENPPTVPAGGFFKTSFSHYPDAPWQPSEVSRVLTQIVDDYNRTSNPGKFALRRESGNRFAVIGISVKDALGHDREVSPILDMRISMPPDRRDGELAVNLICSLLSKTAGFPVEYGGFEGIGDNAVSQSSVEVGGQLRTATELLLQFTNELQSPQVWRLGYDTNRKAYVLVFH